MRKTVAFIFIAFLLYSCTPPCDGNYTIKFKCVVGHGTSVSNSPATAIHMGNGQKGNAKYWDIDINDQGEGGVNYRCKDLHTEAMYFVVDVPFRNLYCWNQSDTVMAGQNKTQTFYFANYFNAVVKLKRKSNGSLLDRKHYYLFFPGSPMKILNTDSIDISKPILIRESLGSSSSRPIIGYNSSYTRDSIKYFGLSSRDMGIKYKEVRGEPFMDTVYFEL